MVNERQRRKKRETERERARARARSRDSAYVRSREQGSKRLREMECQSLSDTDGTRSLFLAVCGLRLLAALVAGTASIVGVRSSMRRSSQSVRERVVYWCLFNKNKLALVYYSNSTLALVLIQQPLALRAGASTPCCWVVSKQKEGLRKRTRSAKNLAKLAELSEHPHSIHALQRPIGGDELKKLAKFPNGISVYPAVAAACSFECLQTGPLAHSLSDAFGEVRASIFGVLACVLSCFKLLRLDARAFNDVRRQSSPQPAFHAIGLRTHTLLQLVQHHELLGSVIHPTRHVHGQDAGILTEVLDETVVVGAEQGAAPQPLDQVAQNGKGNRVPVKGRGTAPELVDDHQRVGGGLAEHDLNVFHLHEEGAAAHCARQFA